MTRYCAGDVRLTEQFYNRAKPYIRSFPRLRSGGECVSCNSDNVQRRGWNYTQKFKKPRIFCKDCRAWTEGRPIAA
jgi:hypothetical protein